MKKVCILSVAILFIISSCNNHRESIHAADASLTDSIPYILYSAADTAALRSIYMPTGFYYLTDNDGVRMVKEHTLQVYNLNRLPFASVEQVARYHVEKRPSGNEIFASLVLEFDKEGTQSLLEGTGNPVYPYVAVVIANRLLYVVKNEAKIKRGVMTISLVGYTDAQIEEMVKAIYQKK